MYVKHVTKNKFLRDSHKESKRIQDTFLNQNNAMFAHSGLIVSSKVQKYLYESENSGNSSKIFKNFLMDACIRSESIAGGSGDICFSFATKLYDFLSKNSFGQTQKQISDILKKKEDLWIESILDNRTLLDTTSFNRFLNKSFDNEISINLVKEVIKVSGIDSVIVTERVNNLKSSIKRSNGFIFDISVKENIKKNFGNWKRKDVNVVVIDGIIESVSEIHHLLEAAADNKEPYIVFCRSMSEEVLHTILHNNARKTIDVLPVEVGLDENTLNILNDITICSNCELVSSLTGDLISQAIKKSSRVEKVEVFENSITIYNQSASQKVKNQIKYLQSKKRDFIRKNLPTQEGASELEDLLDNRIKSLTSYKTTVSIGTEIRKIDPTIVEKLDKFFRSLKSTSLHGVVQTNFNIEQPDELDKIFLQSFKNVGILSTIGAVYIIKNSKSFLNNIFSIGGCLLNEKK